MKRPSMLRAAWQLLRVEARLFLVGLRDPERAERGYRQLALWQHQQRVLRAAQRHPSPRDTWLERRPRHPAPRPRIPLDGDWTVGAMHNIDDLDV